MLLDDDLRGIFGETTITIKMKYLAELFKPVMMNLLKEIEAEEQNKEPLMTIGDIALKFKVSKATIHNWRKEGLITGHKVGKNRYFTEAEVSAALAKYNHHKYLA